MTPILDCMRQVYERVRAELAAGGRAYIVCPLVEGSSVEGWEDMKACWVTGRSSAEHLHSRCAALFAATCSAITQQCYRICTQFHSICRALATGLVTTVMPKVIQQPLASLVTDLLTIGSGVPEHVRGHRGTAGWHLINRTQRHVAVRHQGERAGDRRRRHGQHVRGRAVLALQLCALLHTKPAKTFCGTRMVDIVKLWGNSGVAQRGSTTQHDGSTLICALIPTTCEASQLMQLQAVAATPGENPLNGGS